MDYSGGTVVDLPPATSSNNTQTNTTTSNKVNNNNDIVNNISKRKAKMDERKRELLLEARSARIEWIHSGGADDNDGINNNNSVLLSTNNTNLLNELQACTSDILPCAPQIIESMLSSNCDWRRQYNESGSTSRNNSALRQVIEKQNLSWKLVSKKVNTDEEVKDNDAPAAVQKNASLDLPSIPSSQCYTNFLNTLCEPSAANLVISIQQFCKTIHEAANVMVESMSQTNNNVKESGDDATKISSVDQHNHGTSLAKAVRGFINKTIREMEDHEVFHDYLYPHQHQEQSQDGGVQNATLNEAAREELLASLEKFVYTKCRHDIIKVLLTTCEEIQTSKSMETLEMELHDKMLSLQFVTPTHLEIQSLKKVKDDIDLSYIIQQIQSIHCQSSPRQMLQCILSAHRGVSFALNKVCGGRDPPGADDILPTLILATLRSHPKHLLSSLRFIEDFAPMSLLRGEMGYAYTNLCGAMQFIRELDVDGHMAEVISLEGTGEKSAVLSIGPEEFRLGLELCRRKIEENKESLDNKTDVDIEYSENDTQYIDEESAKRSQHFDIKARDVRKARSKGETIDLDWAMKKQNKSILQQGKVTNDAQKNPHLQQLNLPPEEPPLPSQFSRSYSFLTTHPDNIGIRDLPKLLKEYKMLVHATEKLLNERSVWREGERKRQMRAERHQLEQDFIDYVGTDENDSSAKLSNGH